MSFSNQKRYLNARWLLGFRKLMGLSFKPNGVLRMPFYLDTAPIIDPKTQQPYYRLRFTRKGAEPKVLGPKDTTVHWYFPPLTKQLKRRYKSWRHILQTPSISIKFAEDGLKAAAVMYHTGEPCIGLCGINTGLAAPELSLLKCKGREIELLPDSRATTGVKRGTLALGDEFAKHGGIVTLGLIPTLVGQKSTGPDDFLARYRQEGIKDLRAPAANRRLVQCHGWNSDVVKDWRTSAGIPDDSLPEILRNLEPMPITWMDESPEPIEFGVEGLLAKHEIAAAAAIGGTGKSSVFIRVGMGIAIGKDTLGLRIKKARSVMYCMLERHGRNFRRRVHRATQQLMREAADEDEVQEIRRLLTTNWYPVPLAGEHLGLVKKEHGEWAMNIPLIDELARVSKERGIEMIFVDTISRLHGGSGIDDALAITVVRALERLIMATGCGVVFLGHVGKKERQDQYALFGSSVWVDATSGLITLEAEKPELLRKATILRVELPNPKIDPDKDIVIRLDHRRTSDFAPHPIKHFVIYRQKGSEGEIAACEFGISARDNLKFVIWAARKYHGENGSFTKNGFWTARLAGDVGLKLHHQIFARLIADKELVRDPQSPKKTDLYMPADVAESAFPEEEPHGSGGNYGSNSGAKPAHAGRRRKRKSAKRGNGLGEESSENHVTTPR